MIVLQIVATAVLAESSTDTNATSTTAIIGFFGTVAAAIIVGFFGWLHLKTRKPSDARDDKTAEVATAKSAAEVAMELVDTTKSWALEVIGLLRSENTRLSDRNEELEKELAAVRREIAKLRRAGGDHADEIAAGKEREAKLQAELNEARAQRDRLQAALNDAESRGLEELTLTPEAVVAHRDSLANTKEGNATA